MGSVSQDCEELTYRCPVCDKAFPYESRLPPPDTACSECACLPWCRKRTISGVAILDVIPGRTPRRPDIDGLAGSLVRSGYHKAVIVNLSDLEFVTGSLVGMLLTMSKRIRSAEGALVLCGLRPIVREIFDRFRLDKAIDAEENEEAAIRRLVSRHP